MNAALLSSKSMTWGTPPELFEKLDAEYHFVLDPAATKETAKCRLYYTPEDDGLRQSWNRGGAVFCNPPYGRQLGAWVKKSIRGGAENGVAGRTAAPSPDGHELFSRVYTGTSGHPLPARADMLHGRGRTPGRARAVSEHGSGV